MLDNAMQFSHHLLAEVLSPGDVAIDATMGNGHDTLFLSNLVKAAGQVYSFDIQDQALSKTRELLQNDINSHSQVTLLKESHALIKNFVTPQIKGAIFNLGYLPGGNKSIITHSTSTIDAITQCLQLLKIDGRIILVCYYGHPGGQEELNQILAYITKLDQKKFTCLRYEFINQVNQPPILLCIERKK